MMSASLEFIKKEKDGKQIIFCTDFIFTSLTKFVSP